MTFFLGVVSPVGAGQGSLLWEYLSWHFSFSSLVPLSVVNKATYGQSPSTFYPVNLIMRGLAGHGCNCNFSLEYLPWDKGFQDMLQRSFKYRVGCGLRRNCASFGHRTLDSNRFSALLVVTPWVRPWFL